MQDVMPALSRFELRAVLGRGATGVVYEAFDPRTRSLVALKTIQAPSAEDLFRLKREFRALADVHHPNLVRFGELSSEGEQWYFTMEIVRGTTFTEYVRPGGALDEARLRAALPQLVAALSAIHDAGQLHCDVKPSNVLVSHEGRVVLLDFGLIATRGVDRASDLAPEGTPAFMAPEQIEGEALGPETDWYAVGLMLFLALTGALPFVGTLHQVFEQKLLREAPSPRTLAPDAPIDLADLCVHLLRMSPAARPTAAQIREALGMKGPSDTSTRLRVADADGVFVGRASELRALFGAFEQVRAGQSRLLVVEGEAGVGKSAVVQHFVAAIEASATVLEGRCYEQETVPFKGIDSILDALSEHLLTLSDADARALLAGGVRHLAAVFPVLHRVRAIAEATAGERAVGNASVLRAQAFGELERLLDALAKQRPVVLVVDDLQWADKDSLALLEHVLVGDGKPACMLVATLRPGGAPEVTALTAHATRVPLEGLSPSESRELWDALCPTVSVPRVSNAQRDLVMREAAGHPLFLTELVRSAHEGELERRAGARLMDVLWARILARDELDRRFLEAVAVAGAPTPDAVLARAAGMDLGECQTRLGSLRAAQLVRVGRRGDERMVEPYHDRVREAIVLHLAEEGERAFDARRLALARALLDGASGALLAQRVFAIAQHMNAARGSIIDPAERARLVELNLLAARQARLATSYARARDHARVGLEIAGEAAWREAYAVARDLHIERMQAEFLAGDVDEARACFQIACARITSPEERTALHSSWIELLTGEGRYGEAIASGREALHALGAIVPKRVGMLSVLWRYAVTRLVQRGRDTNALLALPKLEDARTQGIMTILISLAPPAFFSDTNLLTWILLSIAALSMRFGVSDVSSYGFGGYGLVLSAAFGNREEGEAFARFALALDDRFESAALTAKLQMIAGMLVPWVRPFEDAKEHLQRGYEVGRKIGDTTYECYCAVVLSIVSFCASRDLATVREEAEWAREVSVRRKERAMIGVPEAHARHAATLRGLTPSLLDLGTEGSPDDAFRASLSDEGTPTALFYYHFCRADLAYHFGDAAVARAHLREAKKRTQGIFGLPTTVELSLLDALVAAREHDGATSWRARAALRWRIRRELAKLSAWARSCPSNFAPHAALVEAELARVRGRDAQADAAFERAAELARTHASAKREGMACELGAAHARAIGRLDVADARRARAIDAYTRWGAAAKVARLAQSGEAGTDASAPPHRAT